MEKYHGGKVEATGFRVADAAIAGNSGEALRLLRHAIATGVDPVPIVAVLAQQLRQLVRVGFAGRGRSADVARDLGMAPWQVDKARRALSGWDSEALARSIQAAAQRAGGAARGRHPALALRLNGCARPSAAGTGWSGSSRGSADGFRVAPRVPLNTP